jgi:hypothetical protein
MADSPVTGIKPGLNPTKTIGSRPENMGLMEFEIDSAYASDIGLGTIVAYTDVPNDGAADGTLVAGLSGDGRAAVGVCRGVSYVRPADGEPVEGKFYPGGLTPAENAKIKVQAAVDRDFITRGNADISAVIPGQIYAMEASAVNTATGHETALVDIAGGVTLGNDSIDVEIVKILDSRNLAEARVLEVRLVNSAFDR